jgi:hypothetical protein
VYDVRVAITLWEVNVAVLVVKIVLVDIFSTVVRTVRVLCAVFGLMCVAVLVLYTFIV